MTYYIEINGNGEAVSHINASSSFSPITQSKGDKTWYKPATLSDATANSFQDRTGPVYDVDNGTITYSVAYKSLADCKTVKLDQLAAYRFEQETGGITVSGVSVKTDRESQSLITAARIIAKEDNTYTVNWKAGSGFVSLNATQIIAVADAVRSHVQACFDNEATHTAAINALTTAAEVDEHNIETDW